MKDLLTAIRTYYETATGSGGAGLLTSIGPLSLSEAPAGTGSPFTVIVVLPGDATQSYGTAAFYEPQIEFRVFGASPEDSLTAIETLISKFDDHLLTLSGGKINFDARRLGEPYPTPDFALNEQGAPVGGWIVTYQYART
jgi:hypothetical protein